MSELRPKILVVDDEPNNLRVYDRILAPLDLDIIKAQSGLKALAIAHKHDFFLILMDVQMPGMDGFETASLILDHPKTSHIPVIFITAFARDETFEFKGYMNGAVDYLVKPINDEILKSKLGVFLELYKDRIKLDIAFKTKKKAEEELKVHKENLEAIVKARTKELQESIEHLLMTQDKLVKVEMMASLGRLVTGVAHELNTPIGVCVTAASYLEEETQRLSKSLSDESLCAEDLSAYCESSIQGSEIMLSNLNRASNLIKKFKLVAVDVSTEELSVLNVMAHIDHIIIEILPALDLTHHQITIEGDKDLTAETYPETLKQVLKELMLNAINHAFEDDINGKISIGVSKVDDKVRISFRDDGRGIEAETLGMVFDPFFTTSRGTGASGLGLYIVFNLATHVLKGEVSCSSQVGQGTEVIITFPLEQSY